MSTPTSIGKHPLHPMLVVFPIGLWVFSLISDFVFLLGGDARWNDVAFYTMAGGLIGAVLAAVPGFFDMFSISDKKVGKIAWNHMILNLIAVVIFAVDFYLRLRNHPGKSGERHKVVAVEQSGNDHHRIINPRGRFFSGRLAKRARADSGFPSGHRLRSRSFAGRTVCLWPQNLALVISWLRHNLLNQPRKIISVHLN